MKLEVLTIATDLGAIHTRTTRTLAKEGTRIRKTIDGIGSADFVIEVAPGHGLTTAQVIVAREEDAPFTRHFEGMVELIDTERISASLARLRLRCPSMLSVLRDTQARPQVFRSQSDDSILLGTLSESTSGVSDGIYLLGNFFRKVRANATNSFTHSQDFLDASWTATRAAVSLAIPNGPAGGSYHELVEDSSNNTHYIEGSLSGATDDTLQACSIYLKAEGRDHARLEILDKAGAVKWVEFDLTDGSKFADSGGIGFFARDIGGGWFRCFIIRDVQSGGTTPVFRVYLHNGTSITYLGDGSSSIAIYGAQWEKDKLYDGPYVATAGAAASVTHVKQVLASTDYDIGANTRCLDVVTDLARRAGAHLYESAGQLYYTDDPGAEIAAYDLVEKAATNAWTKSEELDDAVWAKGGASVSANFAAAPNGETTADKLVEDTSTGVHLFNRDLDASASNNTLQTFSVYAEESGRPVIRLVGQKRTGAQVTADYNLLTGAVTGVSAGVTASTVAAGDGYRCIFTYDIESGASAAKAIFRLLAAGSQSYTGNGTSGAIFWGMQHDVDKGEAGDYVYTDTASRSGNQMLQPGLKATEDGTNRQNDVTVIGGRGSDGLTLTSTGTDATSVTTFGTYDPETYRFESVTSQDALDDIRDAILALKANASNSGAASVHEDGLEINTTTRVTSPAHGFISKPFLLSALSMRIIAPGEHIYDLTLGPITRRHTLLIERIAQSGFSGTAPVALLGVQFESADSLTVDPPATVDDLGPNGGLSLSFWFLMPTVAAGDILVKTNGWEVKVISGGKIELLIHRTTSRSVWDSDVVLEAGKVYHVWVTWNGGTTSSDCAIFINGAGTTSFGVGGGSGVPASEGDDDLILCSNSTTFWVRDLALWAGPSSTGDRNSVFTDPAGQAVGAVKPTSQLIRWRLDDRTDGLAVVTLIDAWDTLSPASPTGGPDHDEQVYFPLA